MLLGSFSLSQAWQLCSAGLSVANFRQAAGDFKGNALKSCWKRSDECTLCIHTGNSDGRYLPEGSDKGTNLENVHRSRLDQVWSVLSHDFKSYLHRSIYNRWAVHLIKFQNEMLPSKYCPIAGLILGLCPANERRHYRVTPSLIGWAQT